MSTPRPAGKRPQPVAQVFARPGVPSWNDVHDARAQAAAAAAAAGTCAGDAADDAAAAIVTRPWARDHPDAAGHVFADRLWEDARRYIVRRTATGLTWQAAFVAWLASRGSTAAPTSVDRYARHVAPRLDAWLRSTAPTLAGAQPSALRDPFVRYYLKRLGMLWGRSRVRGPRHALSPTEYDRLRRDDSLPLAIRRVIVLAWERKGRIADVLETREGGVGAAAEIPADLHVPPGAHLHVLEQPFHKAAPGGSWARVPIVLDDTARAILGEVAPNAPLALTSPMHRPLLFPDITTRDVREALARRLGGTPGAHSVRRGAIRDALSRGMPARSLMRFTLHSSEEALLAYASGPDPEDLRTLAGLPGGTRALAATSPRTRRVR